MNSLNRHNVTPTNLPTSSPFHSSSRLSLTAIGHHDNSMADYSPYTADSNLTVLASASQVNPVLYCQEIGNSDHCQHCCCPKSNTIAEVLDQGTKQHGARSNPGIKGQKDCSERGSPAPGINSFQDICGKCWISRSKSGAKNDR